MIGKVAGGAIAIIVVVWALFFFLPFDMTNAHDLQTDVVSQTFADVATTSGTSATITLTQEAWKDRIGSIGTIVGGVGDTPGASAISANGLTLTVTGLATSATRNLTVAYDVDALTDYPQLGTVVGMSITVVVLAILGLVIWHAYKNNSGR